MIKSSTSSDNSSASSISPNASNSIVIVEPSFSGNHWLEGAFFKAAALAVSLCGIYALYSFSNILQNALKPPVIDCGEKKALAKRLHRPEIETMSFDRYETRLLNEVLGPNEIDVSFKDIGGMDNELADVRDNLVLPIQLWRDVKLSKMFSCPTGVLLYGLPGTGKSMTAKAIAKGKQLYCRVICSCFSASHRLSCSFFCTEAGAAFLNIKSSSIMDKYVGESDKIVSAIFKLARKLAPSVIFIDEIETVLRKRDSMSFQGSTTMQVN
jgi:ATPase family AAA domain-containing protein 1